MEDSILGHILMFLGIFIIIVIYELGKIYLDPYMKRFKR